MAMTYLYCMLAGAFSTPTMEKDRRVFRYIHPDLHDSRLVSAADSALKELSDAMTRRPQTARARSRSPSPTAESIERLSRPNSRGGEPIRPARPATAAAASSSSSSSPSPHRSHRRRSHDGSWIESTRLRTPLMASLLSVSGGDELASLELPSFELHTPMLVMPFATFKAQGRIEKNVASFRKGMTGRLLPYARKPKQPLPQQSGGERAVTGHERLLPGKIAIFISHAWWNRDYDDGAAEAAEARALAGRVAAAEARESRLGKIDPALFKAAQAAAAAKAAMQHARAAGITGSAAKAAKQAAIAQAGEQKNGWQQRFRLSELQLSEQTFDPDDKGAPDFLDGARMNLKWRTICTAVERLCEREGLDAGAAVLWVDWQSISQDDPRMKRLGTLSLPAYIALSDYMLVPTRATGHIWPGEARAAMAQPQSHAFASGYGKLCSAFRTVGPSPGDTLTPTDRPGNPTSVDEDDAWRLPHGIPGYGERAFCRLESLVFTLWAELNGDEHAVRFFAASQGGAALRHFAAGEPLAEAFGHLPSDGAVSHSKDLTIIRQLEACTLRAYSDALIVRECRQNGTIDPKGQERRMPSEWQGTARLNCKSIRGDQVITIAKAVRRYRVARLNLGGNVLGPQSTEWLAAMLRSRASSLVRLDLYDNELGDAAGAEIARSLGANRTLTSLDLSTNDLGEASAKAFATLIEGNRHVLTRLDLRRNELGKDGERTLQHLIYEGFVLMLGL